MSKYILNDEQKKVINKVIKYAKQFDNYPYKLCGKQPPNLKKDCEPFWFQNEKLPELKIIKKKDYLVLG